MKTSVIFTTYNSPKWLEKVLWGFSVQSVSDFEIVIADDGSGDETRDLIGRMRNEIPMPIQHVWHDDEGFQKCRILNKAILKAKGDYLIFTDGDCIPRADFVATHLRCANRNNYLSGGYFKLPMEISELINRDDIISQRAFDINWLVGKGFKKTHKAIKLTAGKRLAAFFDWISPAKPTWNGHSASCYIEFAIAVNGFEEQMQYGGQDCEFGDRLKHLGLKPKRIRYSTTSLHLDHGHGYVTEEMLECSRAIRKNTKKTRKIKATLGLDQYVDASLKD